MEIHRQLQRNRLAGAVALVTGIDGEPGSAVARRFAAEGARLVVVGTDGDLLDETMDAIEGMGGTALLVEADARTEAGAREIAGAAMTRYGRIDTLVHSLDLVPVAAAADDEDVELCGFYPLATAAAAAMRLQGEGSIVLAAFVRPGLRLGLTPAGRETARVGLSSLMHTTAMELYEHGITVNAVALEDVPGPNGGPEATAKVVQRNFVNAYRRARRFEDVAQTARFLASSEARGITGQVLSVGGGAPPAGPAFTLSPQRLARIAATFHDVLPPLHAAQH